MNVWEGFHIDKDAFVADRDTSQFILWRNREEKVPLSIEYSLQGRKVEFSVNVRKSRLLPPTALYKWKKFNFQLSRGMNFLQFSKKSKDKLSVRTIVIGPITQQATRHLQPGESFSLFHLPGRGRLELSGRGKLEIREQQSKGKTLSTKTRTVKNGWFSRKISLPIEFSRPGLLTVTSKKGAFNINTYAYKPIPAKKAKPGIAIKHRPNIYIVLSDACQASHLGTYGYPRKTSPQLDAFAADAVVYENAYTNAVFTRSSVATIFTGLYPDRHKVRLLQALLPKRLLILPEYLQAKGYKNCVITSAFAISPHFGFTQGVDDYFWVPEKDWAPKGMSIFNRFRSWLAKAPPVHFAYMHFIHPHFPKVPPKDFPVSFRPGLEKTPQERMAKLVKKKQLPAGVRRNPGEVQEIIDVYDSSIAWVDSEFGKIVSLLKQNKLYDQSMIVFLADHGEALSEHNVLGHGNNVYEETARVPLIVKYPKEMDLKGRVRTVTELADVFPTIASLFGQELELDGSNMLADAPGAASDDRMAVSRTLNICGQYGLRWKNWYYMIDLGSNDDQLFSLYENPLRECGAHHTEIKTFLKARFLAWLSRFRNGSGQAAEIALKNLPAGEIEEMKTLGYL
jgi:arylsulfatase A-like enzyme